MWVSFWMLADLEVSFKQSLDIFVGSVLSQSCLEVLQLVQKSIQTLAKLETQHKTQAKQCFLILYTLFINVLMAVGHLLPCGAGLTPMAALSSGQSAPRPLTAQTKLPLSHAAPPTQPA